MLKAGHRVTGARRYPAGVKNSYPVAARYGTSYPRPDGFPVTGSASSKEPYAVRCAQCRVPIENHNALTDCWNCGSDNFLGRTF